MLEHGERTRRAQEIYEEHGSFIQTVFNFHIQSMGGRFEDNEDVVQDFFLILVRNPLPPEVTDERAYLYRAITNHTAKWVQHRKRQLAQTAKYSKQMSPEGSYPSPLFPVITSEQLSQLFGIISQYLPTHQARAVLYRYKYGHDDQKAAVKMGVNRRTFSRYVSTGLSRLRLLMNRSAGNNQGRR